MANITQSWTILPRRLDASPSCGAIRFMPGVVFGFAGLGAQLRIMDAFSKANEGTNQQHLGRWVTCVCLHSRRRAGGCRLNLPEPEDPKSFESNDGAHEGW